MEREVSLMHSPATMDDHFHSKCASPSHATSPPTSPNNLFFFSAPTSLLSTTTTPHEITDNEFEFDFDKFDNQPSLLSPADVLFDGGKIKPLLQIYDQKKKTNDADRISESIGLDHQDAKQKYKNNNKKGTFRVCDIFLDNYEPSSSWSCNTAKSTKSKTFSSFSYKKWNIKDLFTSSSEGRSRNDGLRKYYSVLKKRGKEEAEEEEEEEVGPRRRRESAHERHYKENRAAAEEMRRKTSLPYKHGLVMFGCLGLNSGLGVDDVARQHTRTVREY